MGSTPIIGTIKFQSTPSPKRETVIVNTFIRIINISIHSLPKEGDHPQDSTKSLVHTFQSTPSPKRETLCLIATAWDVAVFQSTPSPKRETVRNIAKKKIITDFNPLPPQRGRQAKMLFLMNKDDFNPLPPQRGRLYHEISTTFKIHISIHSLPKEGDYSPIYWCG